MSYNVEPLVRMLKETVYPANPDGYPRNTYDKKLTRTRLLLNEAEKNGWELLELARSTWVFKENGKVIGGTYQHTVSSQSQLSRTIAAHKSMTKELLESCGVRTPKGRVYDLSEFDQALADYRQRTTDVIMKPSSGSTSLGVTTDIPDEEAFRNAWRVVEENSPENGLVLVEEYVHGFDIRVVVIEGVARAAVSRVNPFVIGDGVRTLQQLIDKRASEREKSAYYRGTTTLIEFEWLAELGYSRDSVVDDGEIVLLCRFMSEPVGRELVEVFGKMSPALIDLAEAAAEAIPFQPILGVDILTQSLDATEAVVLELNVQPHFEIHHYVTYGEPVNVAAMEIGSLVSHKADPLSISVTKDFEKTHSETGLPRKMTIELEF